MLSTLYGYLSEKILNDLRTGTEFSEDLLDALLTYPLVDYLRDRVNRSDKHIIVDMIKSPDLAIKRLGLNLVRRIQHDPEIREMLMETWRSSRGFHVKLPLVWTLAQYDDLPESLHKEFFHFFKSNRELLAEEIEKWFAGKEKIISGCEARLRDRSFYQKRWMYLYCLSFALDKKRAKAIVEEYLQDKNTFVKSVAKAAIVELE